MADDLRDFYQAAQTDALARITAALKQAKIDSILIKGLALAALYPSGQTRPVGDIDLVIEPGRQADAAKLLGYLPPPGKSGSERKELVFEVFPELPNDSGKVDLHGDLTRFRLSDWQAIHSHSITQQIGQACVQTLCHEHHLRLVVIHCLRSGAHRQKWLDDIAALLTYADNSFDWNLVTGNNRTVENWVGVAAKLAQRFAKADLSRLPARLQDVKLPHWVSQRVADALPHPASDFYPSPSLRHIIRHDPASAFSVLWKKWPSPISSYPLVGWRYGMVPPVIAQAAYAMKRLVRGPI